MKYWHSGITVWHGTSDTPGPTATAPPGVPIPVTIAVRPISPGNVVTVQYRYGGLPVQTVRARFVDADYGTNTQYFEAVLPAAVAGTQVRFVPVCECNGRQAPAKSVVAKLPATFVVVPISPPIQSRPAPT